METHEANKANEAIELSVQELCDVAGGMATNTFQSTSEDPGDIFSKDYQTIDDVKYAVDQYKNQYKKTFSAYGYDATPE